MLCDHKVFVENINSSLQFVKGFKNVLEMNARSISVGDDEGLLCPVGLPMLVNDLFVQYVTDWRKEHEETFPSRFELSEPRTKKWLEQVIVGRNENVLFAIQDRSGRLVGHMGFSDCHNEEHLLEVGYVMRGVDDGQKGLMSKALIALMGWGRHVLLAEGFYLRVLADNAHAIAFYEKLGFREKERIPLYWIEKNGERLLVGEGEPSGREPDNHYVRMVHHEPKVDGSELILTAGPSISAREVSHADDAVRYGWNRRWSGYLDRLEEYMAEFVGAKYALATSCCTGAMHIALDSLGLGPGDEVIVPDITWVATAQVVNYVGATPVFADIEPGSWCLSPASLREKITPRTKAVMPVHLYGHPAKMDEILAIAEEHGLYVIEDAAPSIGAEFQGRRTGSFGHFAAFSFQGAKLAVGGEGGILLVNDESLYENARKIWDQGRVPGTFWIDTVGLKYKMSNVQAAVVLGQLERVKALVEAKRRIFSWYAEGLEGVPGITLQREASWAHSIYWMTNITVEEGCPLTRDEVIKGLKENNVDSRPVFPPISRYPIWPVPSEPQPVAVRIGDNSINLPSGVCLKREEVAYVCRTIGKLAGGGSRG